MNLMDRLAACEIEVEKPGRMIVRGLDGKPLQGSDGALTYFDIYSADSEIARKHERAIADERIAARGRGVVTAAGMEDEQLEMLVVLTAGWGVRKVSEDGATIEDVPATDFTPAAARKLYANPRYADIRRQVNEWAGTRVNFAKASPKS